MWACGKYFCAFKFIENPNGLESQENLRELPRLQANIYMHIIKTKNLYEIAKIL